MHFIVLNRRVHYWTSAIVALPLLIVICSGILLQLKKHWAWVQPVEQRGSVTAPVIGLSQVLASLKGEPSLNVTSWDDVERLDVRPAKGIAKAMLTSGVEVQVDLGTGAVMQAEIRRSDWIESLHDGSIFGAATKLGLFLPAAVALLVLWLGGMWMWVFTLVHKRLVRRRHRASAAARACG
jgi:hypothetical protein